MKLETREIFCRSSLQVRETGTGRTISGYAILFNKESVHMWDDDDEYAVEVISPSAITKEFLDKCDIKMTMYHNREKLLARSNRGNGTLQYKVDATGVFFTFEAPKTNDGDAAVELVKRGDIAGCSFAFRTHYWDESFVKRTVSKDGKKTKITYTVNKVTDILDFTLAGDPAYPQTSVSAREWERRRGGSSHSSVKWQNLVKLYRAQGMSEQQIERKRAELQGSPRAGRLAKKANINKLRNIL